MIAEARYGFRWHLAIYIIVNLGLVAIWYFTDAGFPWPLFPILFWGLGVLDTIGARTIPPEEAGLRGRPRRFFKKKRTREPNFLDQNERQARNDSHHPC